MRKLQLLFPSFIVAAFAHGQTTAPAPLPPFAPGHYVFQTTFLTESLSKDDQWQPTGRRIIELELVADAPTDTEQIVQATYRRIATGVETLTSDTSVRPAPGSPDPAQFSRRLLNVPLDAVFSRTGKPIQIRGTERLWKQLLAGFDSQDPLLEGYKKNYGDTMLKIWLKDLAAGDTWHRVGETWQTTQMMELRPGLSIPYITNNRFRGIEEEAGTRLSVTDAEVSINHALTPEELHIFGLQHVKVVSVSAEGGGIEKRDANSGNLRRLELTVIAHTTIKTDTDADARNATTRFTFGYTLTPGPYKRSSTGRSREP